MLNAPRLHGAMGSLRSNGAGWRKTKTKTQNQTREVLLLAFGYKGPMRTYPTPSLSQARRRPVALGWARCATALGKQPTMQLALHPKPLEKTQLSVTNRQPDFHNGKMLVGAVRTCPPWLHQCGAAAKSCAQGQGRHRRSSTPRHPHGYRWGKGTPTVWHSKGITSSGTIPSPLDILLPDSTGGV